MDSKDCNVAEFTFGSLFAGVGGIDLGMERVGFKCKWQVEIDEFATSVLTKHWPNVDRYKDVRQFPPRSESPWLNHRWKQRYGVDVVCAGFPCQDVSNAGRQAGLEGARSGLFYEVIRVARTLQPRAILLENVSALLHCKGEIVHDGNRCLCGWDYRWGRVYHHRIKEQQHIIRDSCRCGDDGQGTDVAASIEETIRRVGVASSQEKREVGRSVEMDSLWSSGSRLPDQSNGTPATEAGAGGDCSSHTIDDQRSSVGQKRRKKVDRRGDSACENIKGENTGTESKGTASTETETWVCPSCGRSMDYRPERYVRASGIQTVLWALAEIGYYAEWCCVPAGAVGAPHRRDRIFILAYSERERCDTWAGIKRDKEETRQRGSKSQRSRQALANANNTRSQGMRIKGPNAERQDSDGYTRSSSVGRRDIERLAEHWSTEPTVGELVNGVSDRLVRFAGRTAYRVPNRVKKLKALGNAVVPQVAEFVATILMNRLTQNSIDPNFVQ